MTHKAVLTFSLIWASNHYAMELHTSITREQSIKPYMIKDEHLQQIKKIKYVETFRNKCVAYTTTETNSGYFGKNSGYNLIEYNKSTKYGFIEDNPHKWNSKKKGFLLNQLLKTTDTPSVKILTDQSIKIGILHIRFLTGQEASAILDAIDSEQALLDYPPSKEKILLYLLSIAQEKI
jgi:hypothetical protein